MICCAGKILEVDLSTGEICKKEIPDEIYENLLSGKGLAAWYLLRNIPAGADPLGPDNVLGFVSGALTGSGALMTGRFMTVAKSPLTGGWGDANCGGFFSPAIKQCGVDGIFFKGIAKTPVYFYMDNTKAEIRDASDYWGLDAVESEKKLTEDNWKKGGKKPRVAVIGPSGEKLSLISGVCTDGGRLAARCGLGAVMGSKMLKAVVLAGTKLIKCAEPETMKKLNLVFAKMVKDANPPAILKGRMVKYLGVVLGMLPNAMPMDATAIVPLMKKWGTSQGVMKNSYSGDGPIKNWGGSLKDAKFISRKFDPDKLLPLEISKYHCYACALGCGSLIHINKASGGEYSESHKPEYETIQAFGPLLLNKSFDSVCYINEILNRAGMDTISAGNTVAFAIECFENNLLSKKDTDGLILSWGRTDAIVKLVKKMIAREGIGDILADGTRKASEHFGVSTRKYAMEVGGQEPGMHDARFDPQLGIHYAADPSPGKHTTGMGALFGALHLCDICSWAPPAVKRKKTDDLIPSKNMGYGSAANSCYTMITDGAGGCLYAEMLGVHHWDLIGYLNAASGWKKTGDDYMKIGKRIHTMRQLFNIKQGISPASWTLPPRMEGNPPLEEGRLKGVTLSNAGQIAYHWEALGWDPKTGIPLESTLEELAIPMLLEMKEA